MTDEEILDLLNHAEKASLNAYAPYSCFHVGAALFCLNGMIYSGCNVENVSYGLTICGERTAVFKAVSEGRTHFTAMAIVASGEQMPYPCGACRQVLAEFCDDAFPIYVAKTDNLAEFQHLALGDLLPLGFAL